MSTPTTGTTGSTVILNTTPRLKTSSATRRQYQILPEHLLGLIDYYSKKKKTNQDRSSNYAVGHNDVSMTSSCH